MKKKLPMAPVRANVRGTRAVHASSTVTDCPGADRAGSGTDQHRPVVRLPSSGAMNVPLDVRSVSEAPPPESRRIAVTSMRLQSSAGRSPGESSSRPPGPRPARSRSRIHVELVLRQAFQ